MPGEMKCGRNEAEEMLQKNKDKVATEVQCFTFSPPLLSICSIYGMINFSVAMVTMRQQSVPASRKWRPEQKGSNERKSDVKNIDMAVKMAKLWGER